MKGNKANFWAVIAVVALIGLTAGIVSAASSTTSITYQGKLADAAGNLLTGSYPVTFSLYDSASGGTALATDSHSVTTADGIFTTAITFDSSLYDGRGLWLGISVAGDPEMIPRQEIRPVPYALAVLGSSSDQVTAIVTDIQTKVDSLVMGMTALQTDISAIRKTVEGRKKPLRYEYYTAPMADQTKYTSLIATKSVMDRNAMMNAGDTPADICWYKYLSGPSSESYTLSSSGCAVLEAGKSRICNPTTVFYANRSEIMKFTTNSSYVIPSAALFDTNDAATPLVTYLPGDFQKNEIYE